KGGWVHGLGSMRRVLYRLPDLAEQTRVYFAEGEKDVETLWSLGLPSTTSPGGARSWPAHADAYAAQLRDVGLQEGVILPDHDATGEEYAAAVARSVVAVGLRTKIVRLPDLAPKGDVSDWIAAGRTREELERVADAVPWRDAGTPVSTLGAVHLSVLL